MGNYRNEVNEYHFSTPLASGKNTILSYSTADNATRNIRVTNVKFTNSVGTAANVRLVVTSYGTYGKALNFDLPGNSFVPMQWDLPYKYQVVASTGATRRFVASTDGAGVKMSISGYTERL